MKKFLSILLTVALVLLTTVSVFAGNEYWIDDRHFYDGEHYYYIGDDGCTYTYDTPSYNCWDDDSWDKYWDEYWEKEWEKEWKKECEKEWEKEWKKHQNNPWNNNNNNY